MEKVVLSIVCKECDKEIAITVNKIDYDNYLTGTINIQKAFPYLSDDNRELILSGICGKCFDLLFI